jgi:MFS family permease
MAAEVGTQSETRIRTGSGAGFRWLLSAASISSLGDGLAVVALPLLAIRLTSDPRLVAGLLFAQRIPWLALSLGAGALADRFPRLRLMRSADLIRAVVLLVAALGSAAGQLSLPGLYLLAIALGSAETVFATASHATLPDLVPESDLDRANGYLFSTQMGGEQLVGPALGGLVFAISGSAPLLADGFSFFASAVLLSQVGRSLTRGRSSSAGAPGTAGAAGTATLSADPAALPARAGTGSGIGDGLRVFRSVPVLRVLVLLMAGLGFCQAMVLALLVLYGTKTLHLGPTGYGIFIAVGSTGNVAGGVLVARIRRHVKTATLITATALASAAAYLVLAATSSVVVAAGAFMVEAFAVACGTVATMTIRQTAVPAEFRGRIASIFRMAIFGAVPLGALAGGLLASAGGIRVPLMIAGGAQLALTAFTANPIRNRMPVPADAAAVIDLTEDEALIDAVIDLTPVPATVS